MLKRIISLILCITCILSMSACKKMVEQVRNEGVLTEAEYRAIRNEELKHKVEKKKDVTPKIIEWYDVKDEISNLLINKTVQIIKEHNTNLGYRQEVKNTHEYLKMNIDNLVCMKNPQFLVTTNEGFYYVRVLFGVKHNDNIADMKKTANYVGINGAIGLDYNGNVVVDEIYLSELLEEVNNVRRNAGKDELSEEIELFNYEKEIEIEDEVILSTSSEIATKSEIIRQIEFKEEEEQKKRIVRRLSYNSREFNNVMSAKNSIPYVSDANSMFDVKSFDTLSGYQIYKEGEDIEGTRNEVGALELVFVYKHNLETDDYDYYTMYFNQYETGIENTETELFIPDYVKKEIAKTIERVSRCYANKDVIGLTSGDLIYPQDLGIKLLLQRNATRIIGNEWYITKYINRRENKYLIEVEQWTSELPYHVTTTASQYLRTYIIEMEMKNANCVIMDMYLTKIKLLSMPEMDIDKGSKKKIYATENLVIENLTKEIQDEIKVELNKLATSLTIRNLNDKFEDDNETIVVENGKPRYGIYSRFNTDKTILNQKTYEEYTQELTSRVTKYGADIPCEVHIRVNQWIAGNEEQVELITDEIYNYNNKSVTKINRYMILSKFKNKWQIDEMKIIDESEAKSNEIANLIKEYKE